MRIGTAEIYRQVEQLPEVLESLAVGQQWQGDERIVLFVRLARGARARRRAAPAGSRIGSARNASPRHVPARIVQVARDSEDEEREDRGAGRADVIHGRPVTNREALANPEALDLYRDLPELRS